MSGETTNYKFKYAEAADEVNKFPVNVDEPKTKEIDKVINEHTLTFKTRAASYEAKSGELGVQTSSAKTVTLPLAATASQFIGVVAKCAEVKVTTSGGAFIIGKAELTAATEAAKVATVVLTEGMTAFFFSDGTNWELWGQIKPEQKYTTKTFTKVEAEAEVEPSATRPAYVVLAGTANSALNEVTVGGIVLLPNTPSTTKSIGFLVLPGQKWKAKEEVAAATQLL